MGRVPADGSSIVEATATSTTMGDVLLALVVVGGFVALIYVLCWAIARQ